MPIIRPQKTLAVKHMSAAYRAYFESIGGVRQRYLIDVRGDSVLKTKPRIALAEYLILAFAVGLSVFHVFFFSSGFLATLLFFSYLCSIVYALRLVTSAHKTNKAVYEEGQNVALLFEPRSLWPKDYPTKGERGELITAVLAARKLLMLLEENTSVPFGTKYQEEYVSHLLVQLIDSEDDDIHEYLYHEVNHICDTAHTYGKMYAPLIGLETIPSDWK